MRATPGGAIILQATTTNGQMTFGPPGTGQFTIVFPAGQITTSGAFTWECKFVDAAGNVSKPFGGQFLVTPTFTT